MKLIYKVTYYKKEVSKATGQHYDVEEVAFVSCKSISFIFKYFDKLKSVEFICEVTQEM